MASSFNQNLPSGLAVFNWSSAATCEGHKERITGMFHYMSAVLIWWFYATGQTKGLTELKKYISDDNMSALTITTNHIQKMLLLGASCMNFISFRKNVSEQPLWQSYYNVISIYSNTATVTTNFLPVHQLLNQTMTSCPFCAVWLCLYMAH